MIHVNVYAVTYVFKFSPIGRIFNSKQSNSHYIMLAHINARTVPNAFKCSPVHKILN